MDADWSVDLTAESPAIAVPWASEGHHDGPSRCKFVDLRASLDRIGEIEEASREPAMRFALQTLNGGGSPFFTAKCDVWKGCASPGEDAPHPFEMDAAGAETGCGAGSYIDLAPRARDILVSFAAQERWIRRLSGSLRDLPIAPVRAEFVLRRAAVDGVPGFGVTWFVEARGASVEGARRRWEEALRRILARVARAGTLQWQGMGE